MIANIGRALTYLVLISIMVAVMQLSGCCGAVYVPKEHLAMQPVEGACSYANCQEKATGKHTAKIHHHFAREGSTNVTYYDAKELPLCDRHARCAQMERWPESDPAQTWFHAIVTGGFLGALLAGTLNVFLFRASEARQPVQTAIS